MLHLDAKSQGHKSRMGESEVNSTEDRGDPGETVTSRVQTSRPRGGAEPSEEALPQARQRGTGRPHSNQRKAKRTGV